MVGNLSEGTSRWWEFEWGGPAGGGNLSEGASRWWEFE